VRVLNFGQGLLAEPAIYIVCEGDLPIIAGV
jgi:hypothetical protein